MLDQLLKKETKKPSHAHVHMKWSVTVLKNGCIKIKVIVPGTNYHILTTSEQ